MSATILPTRVLRYETPLADAARERTRQMMRTHMRSRAVEMTVAVLFFAGLGFAAACQI